MHPARLAPVIRLFALPLLLALALAPAPAVAQQPTEAQVQAALQSPGAAAAVRARILQSGLTGEQIRARLVASGYSPTLLDPYLAAPAAGVALAEPSADALAAMAVLGLAPAPTPMPPVDTGVVVGPPAPHSDVFGVDVFRRTTTQFLPLVSGPVPPDYRLGPGDALVLILTGDVELTHQLSITREGFVLIPQVGQVYLANLTLDQAKNLLYDRLGRVYSGLRRGPGSRIQFELSVANVRAVQVYVVGEVLQPGAYQMSALGTVLTGLYTAGGLTERANLRRVEVRRDGKVAATFDLYDYLLKGDTHNDIRLENGDVVFVGLRARRVTVAGAVVRPAIYEVKDGENLADVMRAAGGFRPDADLRRIAVQRLLPAAERAPGRPSRAVIDIQLSVRPAGARGPADSLGGAVVPPFTLEDGDYVTVDPLLPLGEIPYVAVVGMVQQPGRFPWRAGLTLKELVLLARGPRIGADLREAEVARLPEDRSKGQLATTLRVPLDSSYLERDSLGRYVGPPGVPFAAGGSAAEVSLQPWDNVLILRQPEFELQRTVTIDGEVKFPGTYALTNKSERLSSLIERAGGLTPQAYAEGVRFYRAQDGAGRINLDLTEALRRPGQARDDIILQPGDVIEVPEYLPSVKVAGAVNAPGSVLWLKGKNLDYYIRAAGGQAYNADNKRASVRQANGTVQSRGSKFLFFPRSQPSPGPGAEVSVPAQDPNKAKTDYVAIFGSIAQIIASTVAIIVVLRR